MKPRFNVVLVRTKYPRNIGSTARAMGNLGGQQLYLIDRQCEVDQNAREGAAGAQEPLELRKEYLSLEEMQKSEPLGFYISLTRRTGEFREVYNLDSVLKRIAEMKTEDGEIRNKNIYFVLGPEDHGLSTDEIAKTHFSACLPVFGEFPVFNLAQAALLTLYISQTKFKEVSLNTEDEVSEDGLFPEDLFKQWLTSIGYDLSKNLNASSKLMTMLMRAVPTASEIKLLKSAFYQTIRKLGK